MAAAHAPSTLARLARRSAVAAALAQAAAGPARAQVLAGQVVAEADGAPLAGVAVLVVDSLHRTVASGRSDPAGAFYLDVPRPGRYRVFLLPSAAVRIASGALAVTRGDDPQHRFAVPTSAVDSTIAVAGELADTARWAERGSPMPRYPAEHRSGRPIEGEAGVLVVIAADGSVEPGSVQRLYASMPAFGREVEAVAPRWRFTPARRDGRAVRQYRVVTVDFGPRELPLQAEVGIRAHTTEDVRSSP